MSKLRAGWIKLAGAKKWHLKRVVGNEYTLACGQKLSSTNRTVSFVIHEKDACKTCLNLRPDLYERVEDEVSHKIVTDNSETLKNALARIENLETYQKQLLEERKAVEDELQQWRTVTNGHTRLVRVPIVEYLYGDEITDAIIEKYGRVPCEYGGTYEHPGVLACVDHALGSCRFLIKAPDGFLMSDNCRIKKSDLK